MNAQIFLCQMSVTFFTGDFFETQPCWQELLPIQTSLRAFCRCYRHWILLRLGFVPPLAKIQNNYSLISGMAIERFQAFAVYKNHRHITRSSNNATLHKCIIYVYELQKILHRLVSLFLDYGDTFCHDSSHAGLFLFYNINLEFLFISDICSLILRSYTSFFFFYSSSRPSVQF